MSWRARKEEAERLAVQAGKDAREAAQHRQAIREWSQEKLGNTHALAWSFAAGTVWGAVGQPQLNRPRLRRTAMGVANAAVLAWRTTGSGAP